MAATHVACVHTEDLSSPSAYKPSSPLGPDVRQLQHISNANFLNLGIRFAQYTMNETRGFASPPLPLQAISTRLLAGSLFADLLPYLEQGTYQAQINYPEYLHYK
ncbi:hypothetical protein HYQ45_006569 [Verticillium longisporum]|uniref:Uncharacterized protein n=1 Tax=Verticillium longisporum TaxID=100787 RepID=A0A8I2ZQU5_VERLO|nr:hypothetical protein HYQ45_006569 [Verticillium longisporum]